MKRTYLLDVYYVQAEIRHVLRQYIGAQADVQDITDIVAGYIEVVMCGHVFSRAKAPTDYLAAYGVPPNVAAALYNVIDARLVPLMHLTVGLYDPNSLYEYRMYGIGEIRIEVSPKPQMPDEDTFNEIKQRIEQELSNGDWYSERIRRIVGLA